MVLFPVLFRTVVVIVYFITTLPILWIFLPLRPLNPLLRKLGIQNTKLPLDMLQRYWTVAVLHILGVQVYVEGAENVPNNKALIVMYSHASGLDPFIMMGYCPVATKFVFKKSLLWIAPYLFPLIWAYGHIPINRKNRESAIQSLLKAGKKIKKYNRSVCISPEGTRSITGKLQEFKKGGFHLSIGSNVPIVPVVLFNNFNLWPPGQMLPFAGEIRARFLPAIPPEADDTVDTLSAKVHAAMLKELDENTPYVKETGETITAATVFLSIAILAGCLLYYFLYL